MATKRPQKDTMPAEGWSLPVITHDGKGEEKKRNRKEKLGSSKGRGKDGESGKN